MLDRNIIGCPGNSTAYRDNRSPLKNLYFR
jgi:hypothetical protein